MKVIKKSYYPLHMRNERNGVANIRGNGIVNTMVPVLCTRLWQLSKMRGHYMLNVVRPNNLQDIWQSKILPNHHVISGWKLTFFRIFFCFLLRHFLSHIFLLSFTPHTTNHATYMLPINYLLVNEKYNFNIWNKKIILILILPSCSVILPNPFHNIIISSLPFKFSLAVKIYKKKISVISIN